MNFCCKFREIILSNKNKGISTEVKFVDGLNLFYKDEIVYLSANKEEVTIKGKLNDKKARLKYEKINQVECITEQDIIEKSKNVAARAVMGQLTLGLLEAIVCRMSDMGNKVKTVTKYFIVINYVSDGEEKVLSF